MVGDTNMPRIANDLIEAYEGYYEDECTPTGELPNAEAVLNRILSHSPKERLEVYLEWNGILGYTDRIWEISQGELWCFKVPESNMSESIQLKR